MSIAVRPAEEVFSYKFLENNNTGVFHIVAYAVLNSSCKVFFDRGARTRDESGSWARINDTYCGIISAYGANYGRQTFTPRIRKGKVDKVCKTCMKAFIAAKQHG